MAGEKPISRPQGDEAVSAREMKKPGPMPQECGNCRFWMKRSDHAGEMGGGYCRRYPPHWPSGLNVARPIRNHHIADIEPSPHFLNDAWPMVHQQSWCGEYQRAGRRALEERKP